ncbi:hypothetical protein CHUAL_003712 [Chamberlinius hualienensis]
MTRKQGVTGHLAFSIAACVIGSAFQHGYNTGVVNAPQTIIQEFINETNYERTGEGLSKEAITMTFSLAVSMYCVGGMLGGLMTAFFAERLGRKRGLLVNNIFALIGGLIMVLSKVGKSYEMIIVGRFLVGINSGLSAGLGPLYLSEISPSHLRGAIGTTYQLVVTISILIAQLVGLPQCLGTDNLWPYLFGLTIVPAVIQLCTLPGCCESPKYLLLSCDREVEAQENLVRLRGTVEIHDEMEEMKSEGETMKSVPKVTLKEIVSNPMLRMPLIISVVVMLSQQLSGINAVIFFSTDIFKSAGLANDVALYATIGMGTINVIMTVISLALVERAGRKTLHLIGLSGLNLVCLLLTVCLALKDKASWISFVSAVLIYAFIIFFASGPGSIPWFLVSELFGQGARSLATSIAVTVNWLANSIVGIAFLPLANVMGPYVFLLFSGLLTCFCVFTYFKVPETKNKSSEEVAAYFRQKTYS